MSAATRRSSRTARPATSPARRRRMRSTTRWSAPGTSATGGVKSAPRRRCGFARSFLASRNVVSPKAWSSWLAPPTHGNRELHGELCCRHLQRHGAIADRGRESRSLVSVRSKPLELRAQATIPRATVARALYAGVTSPVRREESSGRHFDVIVIGAGMAGASAAHDLHGAGKSVLILEASDRIGGRIWSDRADGATVDLGAGWIHFPEWNPVKGLASDFAIDTREFDLNPERSAFFGRDRTRLSEDELAGCTTDFAAVFAGVEAYAIARKEEGLPDISLGEAFAAVKIGR